MKKHNFNKLRIIILIILVIILLITSFKSGEKFFVLRNTNFDSLVVKNKTSVSRWYFNARIKNNYIEFQKEDNIEVN